MARKPKIYRKLAGGGFSAVLRHSLWEGPDHLLWVESAIFQEHYRRFYFQDIEAVVLHRTGRRTAWTWVLGAFLLLFAAIAVFSDETAYFSIFMITFLVIFAGVQWLAGSGCRVYLHTAVQKYHITNLVRMRKALKVMDRIRSSAEAVQGPLEEHNLADAHFSGMPSEAAKGAADHQAVDTGPEDVASFGLRLHWILYGLLFLFGLARVGQIWLKSIPLAVADLAVMLCTLALAIIVLARMRGKGKGSLLSLSAWLTLIYSVVHAITVYGLFIAASFRAMGSMKSPYDNYAVYKHFFQLQVETQPIIEAIGVGVGLVSIGLGILGLIAVFNEKQNRTILVQDKTK